MIRLGTQILICTLAFVVVRQGHAVPTPITGDAHFSSFQPVYLTGGSTFATATGLDFASSPWDAIVAANSTGDFALPSPFSFVGATFHDLQFDTPSQVWTISSWDYTFHLSTLNVARYSDRLELTGNGVVSSTSNPDKAPTQGSFSFLLKGNDGTGSSFNFLADTYTSVISPTSVPDGGASVVLLGLSLLGIASFRRILK